MVFALFFTSLSIRELNPCIDFWVCEWSVIFVCQIHNWNHNIMQSNILPFRLFQSFFNHVYSTIFARIYLFYQDNGFINFEQWYNMWKTIGNIKSDQLIYQLRKTTPKTDPLFENKTITHNNIVLGSREIILLWSYSLLYWIKKLLSYDWCLDFFLKIVKYQIGSTT